MVQWLGLHSLTAKGLGSVPDWEAKILQATQSGQKKKKKIKKKREMCLLTTIIGFAAFL